MKKLLLGLTLTLFSLQFSTAQVVALKENDRFTKKNVLQVNAGPKKQFRAVDDIAEGLYNVAYLSFKSVDEIKFLQLNIGVFGNSCLTEDSKAILLFSDESTIELINYSKTDCVSKYQSLLGKYLISDEQIKEIAEKELSEFRIYFSEGYADYKVRDKIKPVIKGSAELFLNELGL